MQDEKTVLFLDLLGVFKRIGLLDELVLLGGWCPVVYRGHFGADYPETPISAVDADFLISNPNKTRAPLDVPAALEAAGFQTQHTIAGSTYVNGDLEVGFLAEKKGKSEEVSFQVRSLHLGAMSMRYLDFLQEHVIKVAYSGFKLNLPDPAAFVLQKFLINPRRSKSMQAKDLETISGLCDYMVKLEPQRARLKALFDALPGSLKKTVLGAADKHAPDLKELLAA